LIAGSCAMAGSPTPSGPEGSSGRGPSPCAVRVPGYQQRL